MANPLAKILSAATLTKPSTTFNMSPLPPAPTSSSLTILTTTRTKIPPPLLREYMATLRTSILSYQSTLRTSQQIFSRKDKMDPVKYKAARKAARCEWEWLVRYFLQGVREECVCPGCGEGPKVREGGKQGFEEEVMMDLNRFDGQKMRERMDGEWWSKKGAHVISIELAALWDDFDAMTEWNARAAVDFDPTSDAFDIMRSPWGWFVEMEKRGTKLKNRYWDEIWAEASGCSGAVRADYLGSGYCALN